MSICLIIFESSLELAGTLGSKRLEHPAILADAKKRSKAPESVLLDMSVHHSALLPEEISSKGRPDIIHNIMLQFHFSLLDMSDSVLDNAVSKSDKLQRLRLFIHTPQNTVFEVPKGWRVPVTYPRFRGLMEELLLKGKIDNPLVVITRKSVEQLVEELSPELTMHFSSRGDLTDWKEIIAETLLANEGQKANVVWLVGGYQRGSPSVDVNRLTLKKYAIAPVVLPGWKVVSTLITLTELALKSYQK